MEDIDFWGPVWERLPEDAPETEDEMIVEMGEMLGLWDTRQAHLRFKDTDKVWAISRIWESMVWLEGVSGGDDESPTKGAIGDVRVLSLYSKYRNGDVERVDVGRAGKPDPDAVYGTTYKIFNHDKEPFAVFLGDGEEKATHIGQREFVDVVRLNLEEYDSWYGIRRSAIEEAFDGDVPDAPVHVLDFSASLPPELFETSTTQD